MRDRSRDYEEAGVRVIGISPDTVAEVAAFAEKHSLGFTLPADADHAVAEAFGTWVEKSRYGKRYRGVQRATFIIGPDGRIARAFPKVSPKSHDEVVLEALAQLSAT